MKISFLLPARALALLLTLSATSLLRAEDLAPPYVAVPIPDVTVAAGAAPTVIKLNKTFALTGVGSKLVRFSTSVGNVEVGLLKETPRTVATFLNYVNTAGSNGNGTYTYNNTLIQRAVPDFVVQGGGFYVDADNRINQIVERPMILGEPGVKNTRGTLAMALSSGPDSGTGDFYFNIKDNANLDDASNGGPFTVFGKVVGGIETLDAIEALPQRNFSGSLGNAFQNVPLINFDGSQQADIANLVKLNTVVLVPLTPKQTGGDAILSLKVKGNTNPGLVTATLSGRKLTLTYTPGQTGTATITVLAKNKVTKSKANASFTVTVQ